jgi:phosphohistidine phosphatase
LRREWAAGISLPMRIVIIRHGTAEDRESFGKSGQDDALRPLTKEGRKKMKKAAAGLKQTVPELTLIATSPLVRAMQTAEILAKEYEGTRVVQVAALSPRKPPAALLEWVNAHGPDATIALIGHEPHLGTFLCWLVSGLQESFVELKKGGAAMVETNNPVAAGRAKLLWMAKPAQLRDMG